jgi:hypothetical protein
MAMPVNSHNLYSLISTYKIARRIKNVIKHLMPQSKITLYAASGYPVPVFLIT